MTGSTPPPTAEKSSSTMMATSMKSLHPDDLELELSTTKDLYCTSSALTELSLSFLESLNYDIDKQEKGGRSRSSKKNGGSDSSFLDLSTTSWNFLDLEDMVSVETFLSPTPMSPLVVPSQ